MIPESLLIQVTSALHAAGDQSPIQQVQAVSGGCINHALRVRTGVASYLLKYNAAPLPDMFRSEARGLTLLRQTRTVRVPHVLAYADATPATPGFMLQTWIDQSGTSSRRSDECLGAALAALHRASIGEQTHYGLDHANYIGQSPQINDWREDWVTFFREQRLHPQIALAGQNGWLNAVQRSRLERLLEHLETWLGGVERQPVLIHGDLWSGNIVWDASGHPALIDPAVSYSDREAEIAFTELFGGFSPRFYAAYNEAWPLAPDRAARRDLYNLYHLLNHANLFGSSYIAAVESVVQHYLGRG